MGKGECIFSHGRNNSSGSFRHWLWTAPAIQLPLVSKGHFPLASAFARAHATHSGLLNRNYAFRSLAMTASQVQELSAWQEQARSHCQLDR